MKTNLPAWLSAALSLTLLSGCNTVQTELVLTPVQLGTKTMVRADRTGACVDLDRSVIPPSRLTLAGGEIGAGYENTFIRGADPLPCNTRRNYAHQGAVLFDLSEVTRRHAVVLEAILEGSERVELFPEGIVIHLDVQRAAQPWVAGNFVGAPNLLDPRAQIPLLPLAFGDETNALSGNMRDGATTVGLNTLVTHTVQDWLSHRPRVANHGFVITARPEHLFAEENENLVVAYGNVRLRLKLLQPRTP